MWTFLIIIFFVNKQTRSETFTIGYITGSQRKQGDLEYGRPGLTISGAISLAVDEVNEVLKHKDHKLGFIVAETYGEEVTSVQKTAELWTQNISVYIGPQETCKHEAFMAAAFNLPMISYYCTHFETSDKKRFPTFARTRPPDTQISKSVVSILTTFNWTHVALLYLKSDDFQYGHVAKTILDSLAYAGVVVITSRYWDAPYHQGYMDNPFIQLVDETYRDTRSEYFVVGVDIDQYDQDNPAKYLRDFLRNEMNPVTESAYRCYLGIVPSSPIGFKNFTNLVNTYMEKPPFNYPNPLNYFGAGKQILAEAAYLYDAIQLYSKALIHVLDNNGDPRNGTAIIDSIKMIHYKSAMGYMVYMDEDADAGGNYTLIARKTLSDDCSDYGLFPIGVFGLDGTNSVVPVLDIKENIDWISGIPPAAVPLCGFRGEHCISNTIEITSGITGGILLAIAVISLILYRNWRYEQELDSLLWKIDFRDVQIKDPMSNRSSSESKTSYTHYYVRTSQVSLSSNPDIDFRYSTVFTDVGVYKGRVLAIKRVQKKCIDITRDMKKELKLMRDLHHDNLNAFVGACTDPPNICILTEYCSKGSLKDILENEDFKLDNMFIASIVGDILKVNVYIYLFNDLFWGCLNN